MPIPQRRGVHKVSEDIMADKRTLVITEPNEKNLEWSRIPDGTICIDPTTGSAKVKRANGKKWEPMRIDEIAEDIQHALEDVEGFKRRMNQLEINQAEVLLKLKAKDMVPDSNLVLIEDFSNSDCIDETSVRVLNINRNIDSISVESLEGIYIGSEYTISDGRHQEKVTIKAIIKSGDNYTIQLKDVVKNTFLTTKTYMYRTTARVNNSAKKCYGAGNKKYAEWTTDTEWTGSGGTKTATLSLNTTQKNKASFTIEGDGTFTADGKFTIASNEKNQLGTLNGFIIYDGMVINVGDGMPKIEPINPTGTPKSPATFVINEGTVTLVNSSFENI